MDTLIPLKQAAWIVHAWLPWEIWQLLYLSVTSKMPPKHLFSKPFLSSQCSLCFIRASCVCCKATFIYERLGTQCEAFNSEKKSLTIRKDLFFSNPNPSVEGQQFLSSGSKSRSWRGQIERHFHIGSSLITESLQRSKWICLTLRPCIISSSCCEYECSIKSYELLLSSAAFWR